MDRLRALEVEALAYSTMHVVGDRRAKKTGRARAVTLWSAIVPLALFWRRRNGNALVAGRADALGRNSKSSAGA